MSLLTKVTVNPNSLPRHSKKNKQSTPIPLSPNRLSHVLIPSSSSVSWFIFSAVKIQNSGSGSEITICIQILAQSLSLCHTCLVLTGKMRIIVISASQDDGGEKLATKFIEWCSALKKYY